MADDREKQLRTLDEQIAQALREAEASGELRAARHYGKPIDFGDGYEETPAELRMAFKVLKDAGCAPPEVAMLNELALLREKLGLLAAGDPRGETVRARISQLEVEVSLRIERLASRKP